MKKIVNRNIFKVQPYIPGKPIEEVKRELGLSSVIKLASNENPYGPSPKVLAAVAKEARTLNRYPDGGCFRLRQILARHLGVAPNQLIFGNGSDEVIVMAVRAFVQPGDEVIIAKPSFLVYDIAAELAGARVRAIPLRHFRYDLDAMRRAVTARTKIIFIGNPDNPAGTFVNQKQLDDFLKKLRKNILVFVDEAYFEFVSAKDYPDTIRMLKRCKNLVVTRTFSKLYGLAGLRVGYGIASPEMVDILDRVREPFNVNSIAQAAAVACLTDQPYYRRIARQLEEERKYLYKALTDMGVCYEVSWTNFILVKVRPGTSTEVSKALLKKGVIIRDMAAWGLTDYIRVTIGSSQENKKFIKALRDVLK